MKVSSFRDLMAGHKKAEIYCIYTTLKVRVLTVEGDRVQIDAMEPPIVSVPLNTPIEHEPWLMDRGNMVFAKSVIPELAHLPGDKLKICGAGDIIKFTDTVEPAQSPTNITAARKWLERFAENTRQRPMPPGTTKEKAALAVIALTHTTSDYLAENDPMALKQIQEALDGTSFHDFL